MTSVSYEDFAARLHAALDRAGFDKGRARTGALSIKYGVSRETARKWLSGLTLPEMERLVAIACDFRVAFEWLVTGRGPMGEPINPPTADGITEERLYRHYTYRAHGLDDAIRSLDFEQQQALLKLIRAFKSS